VERELVLRLASLLWRLRHIQADHLKGLESCNTIQPSSRQLLYALFEPRALAGDDEVPTSAEHFANPTIDIARCFLRLSNLPNYALDRLNRYEGTLPARLLRP
jgi:hypothetical protein